MESRDNWEKLRNDFKVIMENLSESLYSECRRVILAKMSADSAKVSRLGDLDVELYDHCLRLMEAYRETIGLYERFHGDIHSPEARKIIDGIITVLVSRLREFEEVTVQKGSNPIADEKQAIISRASENLELAVRKQFSDPAESIQWLRSGSNKTALLESVRSKSFPALYESYRECISLCRIQLSDLNKRKAVQLYLALMEDEWEILSTIIKIQVRALEQAVEQAAPGPPAADLPAADALEKLAIHKILSLLREAYQHFGRASTEISAVFHRLEDAPSEQWEPDSYEDFESYLLDNWEAAGPFEDEDKIAQIKAKIEQETATYFGRLKLDFYKSVYRFRRMVSVEMMLADEIATAFVRMREKWPKTGQEGEAAEILRGIAETIEIKIDSLRESIGLMTAECNSLIESFANENSGPEEAETESAKDELWQLWFEDNSELSFEEACPNLPVFTKRRENHEKTSSRCQENLEKKLTRFKREILLYEISTYEEIIFYSISRLREFEAEEFQQAAALADNTLDYLAIILKKNNIEVIRPQANEPFDPKEHEVLMAETNPNFKKGEIVKLMNSGYRQNGVILLRANVIAAR